MLFQKALSGTGSATTDSTMDRERAYLIRWPAGFDSRGLPVYLRKWFHTCGAFGAVSAIGTAQLANTSEISGASRTAIANVANALDEIGVGEAWDLTSKTGRNRDGSAQCHRFLEHHQLGDMWR